MGEWREYKLADLANLKNGKGLNNKFYTDFGKSGVWGANGQIAFTNEVLNSEPVVVIGRVGAYCGSIHMAEGNNWVTDNAIQATPKNDTDLSFLYYLLKNLNVSRAATGSAQPLITQSGIGVLECKAPSPKIQKEVASILSSLDDKIELNRKMNETLEEMARTIFKSWFVDFDPVHAKARGEKPAGMPDEIADLFPSEFEFSDQLNKPIPKGWEVKQISDFAEKISKGTTPKKEDVSNALDAPSIPFIKVKDISDDGQIILSDLELIPASIHEKHLKRSNLLENDILFSIAGTIGRVSIIDSELTNSNTNQAVAFIRLSNVAYKHYISLLLKSNETQNHITSRIVQGVQANVSLGELGKVPCIAPPLPLFEAFNRIISSIFFKVENNHRENNSLIYIRDSLLPKLISGEIEV